MNQLNEVDQINQINQANQEIMNKLEAPFAFEEVEAKIQVNGNNSNSGKGRAMVVFYLDSRAVQKRLDEVVGAFNWKNQFSPWHDNSQICGISIFDQKRGEWITKHDGAGSSNIESIKGGLTDAFKRAAVLWGIGRYLYQIDGVWIEVEQKGRIDDSQRGKLKAAYDAAVKRIFGDAVNRRAIQPTNQTGGNHPVNQAGSNRSINQPVNHSANNQATTNQRSVHPHIQQQPQNAPDIQQQPQNIVGNSQPQPQQQPLLLQQPSTQAPANEQRPTAEGRGFERNAEQNPQTSNPAALPLLKINSIKQSGKTSQLLELCNCDGEITSAYIKSGEEGIAIGAYLRNVRFEEKTGSYGKYNLIADYELHGTAAA